MTEPKGRGEPSRVLVRGRSLVASSTEGDRLRDRVRGRLFGNAGLAVPSPSPSPRRIRSRYRLEEVLGEGGMGAVFRAYDEATNRHVALKRLTNRHQELEFRREFHTLATLSHPNIVQAFDYGIDDEGPYYTMELLAGEDLRALKNAEISFVCSVVRDIASALAFLHARRLVHRDVTVRNIGRSGAGAAKLIDFGLLSTTAVTTELAGTPQYVAPELLRGAPLDPRADLFALGAVAYRLLSGKHAFTASSFEQAVLAHATPPEPLAALRNDVPRPLSDLVARLLSVDPLARPSSAVEVLDRLGRWLPASSDSEGAVVSGYLASTTFLGRKEEMDLVLQRARDAAQGRGGALLLEGPSGAGKSRFLRELAIESKVRGATVIFVNAGPLHKPYGPIRAAIAGLLESASDSMTAAVRAHVAPLAAVVPELGHASNAVETLSPFASNEQRLLVQQELKALFLDAARERPLVLLFDDIQRAEEATLAVLASIARPPAGVSLLLIAACATDEPPCDAAALTDFGRRSEHVPLRGLGRSDVHALVRALFGDVPNSAKLADAIHESGGGSPLACTEIARHLVDSNVVRYAGGMWIVPDDVAVESIPNQLDATMDSRVASLSPNARHVAVAMAVYGGEVPLELAVTLGAPLAERDVFTTIDELVMADVLIGRAGVFRISHRAVRAALLRPLSEDDLQAHHSRIADALRGRLEADSTYDAEVGHHLLCAGRAREAAPLLHRAGRRLYETQSLRDAIPVLETALTAYEGDASRSGTVGELRQLLVVAGAMADRDLVLRQGDIAFADAWTRAGLDVGEAVARVLGRPIGLFAAMLTTFVRRLRAKGQGRAGPIAAIRNAIIVASAAFAAYAHLRAFDKMEALLAHLRLFDVFHKTVPHTAYRLSLAMYELSAGRRRSTRHHCDASLTALSSDRWTKLSGYDRLTAEAAIRNTRAWVAVIDQDPSFEEDIGAIERMDLPSYGFSCAIYRAIYHRHRGEELPAREMEERAESIRVQLGTLWMWEGQLWQQSSLAYAVTRDAVGLKRCIEELLRMERQGYQLADVLTLARANYLREHGEVDEAWSLLQEVRAKLTERSVVTQDVFIAIGETALARGDSAAARETARHVLDLASDPDRGLRSIRLRATRVGALAMAVDEPEAAFRVLDPAIGEAERLASPSLAGALHEAAVGVAIEASDDARATHHLHGAYRWFRPTQTPALVARLERLRTLRTATRAALSGHVSEVLTITHRKR